MSFSSSERAKLASLLHQLGPAAPTLCGGWTTQDLAAHLWLRENRPKAAAGMFIPALAAETEKCMQECKQRDYDLLVDQWAKGTGKCNPLRYVDSVMNFAEHFVHHEDVRRANDMTEPRDFSAVVVDQMYKSLKLLAPRMLRKSSKPVALIAPGYPRILAADSHGVSQDGKAVVSVLGEVPELLLWVYGRDIAQVDIKGDVGAIERSSI